MAVPKKILVPTDFSGPSKAAADLALDFAERFAAPIVLVHVHLAPMGAYTPVPIMPSRDYVAALEDAVSKLLEEEASRLSGRGVEVTTLLRTGFPSDEILVAAKQVDAGLIIMGTHGRRGLPRALLGSIAEKMVRLSPVPVLTVHQPAVPSDAGLEPTAAKAT